MKYFFIANVYIFLTQKMHKDQNERFIRRNPKSHSIKLPWGSIDFRLRTAVLDGGKYFLGNIAKKTTPVLCRFVA